jgi:hypothetical protein
MPFISTVRYQQSPKPVTIAPNSIVSGRRRYVPRAESSRVLQMRSTIRPSAFISVLITKNGAVLTKLAALGHPISAT